MLLKSIGLSKHSSSTKKKKKQEIEKSPWSPFILADYHHKPEKKSWFKYKEENHKNKSVEIKLVA